MAKILIVDGDQSMRQLLRLRLADTYEIIDTGEPEQALSLALEHRPEAIFLDLMMPKHSGFQQVAYRSSGFQTRVFCSVFVKNWKQKPSATAGGIASAPSHAADRSSTWQIQSHYCTMSAAASGSMSLQR